MRDSFSHGCAVPVGRIARPHFCAESACDSSVGIYSRAALPFGKTALFVMKMKKPNYLAFMAAL